MPFGTDTAVQLFQCPYRPSLLPLLLKAVPLGVLTLFLAHQALTSNQNFLINIIGAILFGGVVIFVTFSTALSLRSESQLRLTDLAITVPIGLLRQPRVIFYEDIRATKNATQGIVLETVNDKVLIARRFLPAQSFNIVQALLAEKWEQAMARKNDAARQSKRETVAAAITQRSNDG